MRASGQPTLPVVGLQQLNDFAESYSAVNLDLKVANTRRSQLAQTRGRKVSAALARGGRRSPGTAAPHTKRTGLVEKLGPRFPSTLHRRRSRGEPNTSTDLSPLCYCAVLARLRRWTRFLAAGAPRVPDSGAPIAAATARPARARDWARARDPARCRTLLDAPAGGTDLRRLSIHQLQLQCTAKHATRRFPPQPPVCDAPLARPILATRRPRAPPRPPAASCAMHCTPLCARPPQGHTHTAPVPPRPTRPERTRCSPRGN